jgi:putative PIN family toxin of toxin-antitoxin system
VFVSAAMNAGGVPYRAFDLARTTDRLAMSQAVFDEVDAVLHRPTLARFVDPGLRAELLDQLLSGTEWFLPVVRVLDCRDPDDNMYLELALAAQASAIVSGDQDLLVLHPWRGIPIVRPADYLAG